MLQGRLNQSSLLGELDISGFLGKTKYIDTCTRKLFSLCLVLNIFLWAWGSGQTVKCSAERNQVKISATAECEQTGRTCIESASQVGALHPCLQLESVSYLRDELHSWGGVCQTLPLWPESTPFPRKSVCFLCCSCREFISCTMWLMMNMIYWIGTNKECSWFKSYIIMSRLR